MAWMAFAAVASAMIQSSAQDDTNQTNREIQENNSAFNAEQAQLNRAFQNEQADEQMAFQQKNMDSVWQRGTADMKAAGLNPMLGYSQGGNPTGAGAAGQGSQATAGQPGNAVSPLSGIGSAAMNYVQTQNIEAQTERIKAETENIRAELPGKQGSGQLNDAMVANLRSQTVANLSQADLTANQREKVIAEVNKVIAEEKNIDADTLLKKVNTILQQHDVPRMKAEAAYFKSTTGAESPANKYGPQTPFRMFESIGERIINRNSAKPRFEDNNQPRQPW